jgi:hypothetical protein
MSARMIVCFMIIVYDINNSLTSACDIDHNIQLNKHLNKHPSTRYFTMVLQLSSLISKIYKLYDRKIVRSYTCVYVPGVVNLGVVCVREKLKHRTTHVLIIRSYAQNQLLKMARTICTHKGKKILITVRTLELSCCRAPRELALHKIPVEFFFHSLSNLKDQKIFYLMVY